jgi:hypothetical protein
LRAGHYWPWISVYFEGIAANKQGIDGQWPPLNLRPAFGTRLILQYYYLILEEKSYIFEGMLIKIVI